jgi:hypothetical protein
MVIKMKNNKLKKIQDLIIMIDNEALELKLSAKDILTFYYHWMIGDEEFLETLIKAINSTLEIAKRFEIDLKNLKRLLKELRESD